MATVDIGRGKRAQAGFGLDQVSIVPSRRTRDADAIETTWRIDAYSLAMPAVLLDPPAHETRGISVIRLPPEAESIDAAELKDRLAAIDEEGGVSAIAVRPQRAERLLDDIVAAQPDVVMILGRVVSAEHVSLTREPLNLKSVIRTLELPVIVGGCASYQAALHLMRTGAAGVIIGSDVAARGVGVPLATAIANARAARMRHLDETGVYCHLVAAGGLRTGGDVAKAVVCGADAVLLESDVCEAANLDSLEAEFRRGMATCGYDNVKEFQNADLVTVTS